MHKNIIYKIFGTILIINACINKGLDNTMFGTGLNLKGYCKECNKASWNNLKGEKIFYIGEESWNLSCSCCGQTLTFSDKIGLSKCRYRFEGYTKEVGKVDTTVKNSLETLQVIDLSLHRWRYTKVTILEILSDEPKITSPQEILTKALTDKITTGGGNVVIINSFNSTNNTNSYNPFSPYNNVVDSCNPRTSTTNHHTEVVDVTFSLFSR